MITDLAIQKNMRTAPTIQIQILIMEGPRRANLTMELLTTDLMVMKIQGLKKVTMTGLQIHILQTVMMISVRKTIRNKKVGGMY